MDSFYGGKPGVSFIIVRTYKTVEEMATYFKQGPSYSTVHYDEHVLINTENKNNPENGRIYRRGYDFTNELGGAIYVGTIVGPAGRAPMLELTTIDDVNSKQAEEGFDIRKGEGSYSPTNGNIVPGKTDGGIFNDEIEWAYCSVRNANDEDSTAYIGFKIPYTVIDFTANTVSPYYNRNNNTADFINQNLSERTDDKTHPFYEKWNFSIPKGIKGDTLKNFRVIEANNSISEYDGQSDDVTNKRKVLVYDYYHYDAQEGGEPVTLYLGDYNMIKEITIDNEGTFTVDYEHDDNLVYSKLFKWIKSVTLNGDTGHLIVLYNHDTDSGGSPTKYETDLRWVNNLTIGTDGQVTLKYTTGEDIQVSQKIKWITSIEMAANGTVTVNYNNGDPADVFSNKIQWINNITLTDDGTFTVEYNNGTPNFSKQLRWPTGITIADDGTITISYNNGSPTTYSKYVKAIKNISINANEEESTPGNQKVHVVYNTGDEEDIGQPLNYIMRVAIDKEDNHLLILFSDPEKRPEDGREYESIAGWKDLGSIRDYSGLLVGPRLSSTSIPQLGEISSAIEYLNGTYPNGFTDPDDKGKILTVETEGLIKQFYAFDYGTTTEDKTWFHLGSLNNNYVMLAKQSDADFNAKKADLPVGGIWFIIEEED